MARAEGEAARALEAAAEQARRVTQGLQILSRASVTYSSHAHRGMTGTCHYLCGGVCTDMQKGGLVCAHVGM
jgi:hypothetical protein